MCELPATLARVLDYFAPVFSRRIWARAQLLLLGAILAPGARTVTAALRAMGQTQSRAFPSYHRVLSRARWSPLRLACILLDLLLAAFLPPEAPVVLGLDETLERRRGKKILAKGLYRDAARSSKSVQVKSHGLRWIGVMLLAPILWAARVWALPFLTLLVPSEGYCPEKGKRYKTLSHWARQAIVLLSRWLKGRKLIVVADNNYSALELLHGAQRVGTSVITRLRLNAALYDPAPSEAQFRKQHPRGKLPKKGARQPTPEARLSDPATEWKRLRMRSQTGEESPIDVASGSAVWFHNGKPPVPIRWGLVKDPEGKQDPQCFLSTDQALSAEEILGFFHLRWQVEVTFQEVRTHLGVETQRQWSEKAIERTTPVLLGLFSVVTLLAKELLASGAELPVRRSAWYAKELPTFADTLALVRQHLWSLRIIRTSREETDVVLIPQALLHRMTETLAYAA